MSQKTLSISDKQNMLHESSSLHPVHLVAIPEKKTSLLLLPHAVTIFPSRRYAKVMKRNYHRPKWQFHLGEFMIIISTYFRRYISLLLPRLLRLTGSCKQHQQVNLLYAIWAAVKNFVYRLIFQSTVEVSDNFLILYHGYQFSSRPNVYQVKKKMQVLNSG